jgi:hypothetical protein
MRASKEIGVRMERERGKDERKQRDWSSDGEREGKMSASKETGERMERERGKDESKQRDWSWMERERER